jgi:hypothetical protein
MATKEELIEYYNSNMPIYNELLSKIIEYFPDAAIQSLDEFLLNNYIRYSNEYVNTSNYSFKKIIIQMDGLYNYSYHENRFYVNGLDWPFISYSRKKMSTILKVIKKQKQLIIEKQKRLKEQERLNLLLLKMFKNYDESLDSLINTFGMSRIKITSYDEFVDEFHCEINGSIYLSKEELMQLNAIINKNDDFMGINQSI